jgi:predicted TIM-barrel fold metal-dependent hydrolase
MTHPVVDAHHHVWRRADQPWLQGPTVPRIFGDYEAIKRDYPMAEYLADIEGSNIVKSVYVQTNWAKERAALEVQWVHSIAVESGWPHGIVGYADLQDDNAAEVMATHAKVPLMRGIRYQLHWHENPLYRFSPDPDEMNTPLFRRNFALIQDHGWLFELQIFAGQMAAGAELAKAFPETIFVLEHAGMPEDRSDHGRRTWRQGMMRLADQPNMFTKLSGLGTFIRRNDAQEIADIVGQTVEIFGADRCVWGSNFPIEKLWTGYAAILDAVRAAIASLSDAEQRAILHDTAARLYRL